MIIEKSHQQCPSFFLMSIGGIKYEYGIFWVLIFLGKGYNLMPAVEVALVWNTDWAEQEQQLVWEYW